MSEHLPEDYVPNESEEYMNTRQLAYFKNQLETWRDELLRESEDTIHRMRTEKEAEPEAVDRGSLESQTAFELRTRDRYRKLIKKIENALGRIESGTYGYCEETDEPIGIKRLMARPVATLCIEAQERHEKDEKAAGA